MARINPDVREQGSTEDMTTIPNRKLSSWLFMSAGCAFFVAAIVGVFVARKPAFYSFFGLAAANIAIGAAMLHGAKRT